MSGFQPDVLGADRKFCKVCAADCTTHHYMCDRAAADDDDVWCGPCFDKTACGQGHHGEDCPTGVYEG